MKRYPAALLATFYALSILFYSAALAVPAHARWVTEPIYWQTSATSASGGIGLTNVAATRFAGVITSNGGPIDTTSTFRAQGVGSAGLVSTAVLACKYDSLVAGYLIIQGDSSIASTFSTATFQIDGRAGGYSLNTALSQWVKIDTVSVLSVAANSPVVIVPIRARTHFALGVSPLAFDALRAHVTAGVGIMYNARIFWKYWVPDGSTNR